MKPITWIVILLALTYGCGSGKPTKPINPASEQAATTKPLPVNWYQRFEGLIGDMPVVVHLQRYGDHFNGCYYYVKTGQMIQLRESPNPSTDRNAINLNEYLEAVADDQDIATWRLTLRTDSLTGFWQKRRKNGAQAPEMPIRLTAVVSDSIATLVLDYLRDSAQLANKAPKPVATATACILSPATDMAHAAQAFLESSLYDAFGCIGDLSTARECMQQVQQTFFNEWRATMVQLAESDSSFDRKRPSNNYQRDQYQVVRYNDRGWLTIEAIIYEFTGGAHGNYASRMLHLDWLNQETWSATDVLKPADTGKLFPLLQTSARRFFNLSAQDSLTQYLFERRFPMSTVFYLNPAGLTFCYNPYEIAPYSVGQIWLYVPYTDLRPYLTDRFRKRMNIP